MEFSWLVFAWVAIVNTLCIGIGYVAQVLDKSLPPRHSIIPGTKQKFLYMQDFYTLYGDLFAVPLLVTAFVNVVFNGLHFLEWIFLFVTAIADVIDFLWLCMKSDHKPDQGFPAVHEISWNGLIHLPYHGVVVAMSAVLILHVLIGDLTRSVFYMGLIGGILYAVSFIADIKAGNFDRLKRLN